MNELQRRDEQTRLWYAASLGEANFMSEIRNRLRAHAREDSYASYEESVAEAEAIRDVHEFTYDAEVAALERDEEEIQKEVSELRSELEVLEKQSEGEHITNEELESLRIEAAKPASEDFSNVELTLLKLQIELKKRQAADVDVQLQHIAEATEIQQAIAKRIASLDASRAPEEAQLDRICTQYKQLLQHLI